MRRSDQFALPALRHFAGAGVADDQLARADVALAAGDGVGRRHGLDREAGEGVLRPDDQRRPMPAGLRMV